MHADRTDIVAVTIKVQRTEFFEFLSGSQLSSVILSFGILIITVYRELLSRSKSYIYNIGLQFMQAPCGFTCALGYLLRFCSIPSCVRALY